MRIIFCFISFDGGSEDCCNRAHCKTGGEAKKHTNTGLLDMKTVVLIFFHILCAWYPDFFRMAKPDAVKHQSVIPINDQPDQVGILRLLFLKKSITIIFIQNLRKQESILSSFGMNIVINVFLKELFLVVTQNSVKDTLTMFSYQT